MPISKKLTEQLTRSSWIRKMFEKGEELRKIHGAENIFDFSLGNPVDEPPAQLKKELLELASHPIVGMHRYMSNAGYDETRAAVAAKIARDSGVDIRFDKVVMACGAAGALNIAIKTLIDRGDEVIVLVPCFCEYYFYIDNHGGVPVEVWTDRDTFQLDIEAIQRAITEKTRAIIICNPNNPTGTVYSEESLKKLGDMLREHTQRTGQHVYVISDEPYAQLVYDGRKIPHIFNLVDDSIIATSFSKDLALPGERIGYVAANPRMASVDEFIGGTIFCNRILGFMNAPALMQRLIVKLMDHKMDISDYEEKRNLFANELKGMGYDFAKPEGAFYIFPKSPIPDDIEFVNMGQKHNLLFVPGVGFGAPGYFRISYSGDKETIIRSLPAWRALAKEVGLKG